MKKATIIEAQNSSTVYDENSSKGTLGKIKGVFADYKNGTRNGNRLYCEELWDSRVFDSEDVMEALETRTLFGELDHPEGDRCETLAKNAAITITKLEKRPDEGVIYGEAEILNTPTGQTLKALIDAGAQMGISSRGLGEEIYEEGQNIIDPETYDFITFDVVVTPANKKARVALAESKHRDMLKENLQKAISNSTTHNQLFQIKEALESTNVENKQELVETINAKLEEEKEQKVLNAKLQEANRKIALAKYESMLDDKIKENEKLFEENKYYKESRELLKGKFNETKTIVTEHETKYTELEEKYNKLLEENKELNTKLEESLDDKEDTLLRLKAITNKKLENKDKECEEKLAKLQENEQKLAEKEDELSKILLDKEDLLKENKELKAKITNQLTKLNESKKIEENKKLELENKVKQMEKEMEALKLENKRLNNVSFNTFGTMDMLYEGNNAKINMTSEEQELFNILTTKR